MPGNPAARLGDPTDHGGTIGPEVTGTAAQVNIGGQPAACQGDPQTCPMTDGAKPHVGGIITKGSSTVKGPQKNNMNDSTVAARLCSSSRRETPPA